MTTRQNSIFPRLVVTGILSLIIMLFGNPALGQLTDKDIADLKKQSEAEGWTFTVGNNPAAGYPLERLCGTVEPDDWRSGATFDPCVAKANLPLSFDWRSTNGVTPIKDQGDCGSCWAFATVGALECNIKIKDGITVDLSEQWLLSCNSDCYDCDGGWYVHDYHKSRTDFCGGTGAVLESDFPYLADEVPCDCPYPHRYTISSWAYIGSSYGVPSVDAMKQAIMDYGPISVGVYANRQMQSYTGGIFNACSDGSINHSVVLVGWDDSQGDSGVWIMRNSWGPGWGEGGYMRMPYGCSRIGYAACYVRYLGAPKLTFSYPDSIPRTTFPGQSTSFSVVVTGVGGGSPVSNSGQLHYAVNGGSVVTTTMTQISPNTYQATLPVLSCGNRLEFYVSAQEWSAGRIYDPIQPKRYKVSVATRTTVAFQDDFELDKGWTSTGDAATGLWERGVPKGEGARGDPPIDFDGSGSCFVTENEWGNTDVDEGTAILTSPLITFPGPNGRIQYARWYYNDAPYSCQSSSDQFKVYLSIDNGASWKQIEAVSPLAHIIGDWYEPSYWVGDVATPTGTLMLRFEAGDLGGGDIIEAAVDDVVVTVCRCEEGPLQITTADLPDWTVGIPYWQQLDVYGGLGAVTWSDKYGALSGTGLVLSSDGVLSGIPGAVRTISFTARVVDEYGGSDEHVFDFIINPAVQITSSSLPDWTAQCLYSRQLAVSGGTGAIEWTDKFDNLSAHGLSLSPTGLVSGTPTAAGTVSFFAVAVDDARASDEQQFTFTVNPQVGISTTVLPDGAVDEPYSRQLAATGGTGSKQWTDKNNSLTGSGLTLSPEGLLAGTASQGRRIDFTAKVQDAVGSVAERTLSVAIIGPYVCGDANDDDGVNVGDVIYLIAFVFKSGPPPFPAVTGDANCDGAVNVADAVYILNYVFKGGAPPSDVCCP